MFTTVFIQSYFTIGLVVSAALFLPQIYMLFRTKDSNNLSLTTFFGFNIIQLFMIAHGFLRSDFLLAYGNILKLITCGMVTVMIVYLTFRKRSCIKKLE